MENYLTMSKFNTYNNKVMGYLLTYRNSNTNKDNEIVMFVMSVEIVIVTL